MAHPMSGAMSERHAKARSLLSRTGNSMAGGDEKEDAAMIRKAVAEHESNMHMGQPKTSLHLKTGGAIDGDCAKPHLARRARGGSTGKKSTHVNVIVAPQGGGDHPPGMMPAAQPMAPPRPPMAPPPGAGQPMMPPRPPMAPPPGGGMRPPGMMKRGGGVSTSEEGVPAESLLQAAKGGKVPHMTAGAMSGEGRIQKMEEYGEGGFKPKDRMPKGLKR